MTVCRHTSSLRLVANILKIPLGSITDFVITNPEVPPEVVGDKFCRLDINMIVEGQRVDLEVQVSDLTKDDELKLWLSLFNAKTEEELMQIEALEVPIMSEAIVAYRSVTADEKFKELERLRSR